MFFMSNYKLNFLMKNNLLVQYRTIKTRDDNRASTRAGRYENNKYDVTFQ